MYISLTHIREILNLLETHHNAATYHMSNSGPGRLDFNAALEGNDAPWVAFESEIPTLNPLTSIILSVCTARILEFTIFDKLFLTALLDAGVDIYVWEGVDAFEQSSPITSIETIWQKFSAAPLATEKSISETLAKIGSRDTKVFHVFDTYHYWLLRELCADNHPLTQIEVDKQDETWHYLAENCPSDRYASKTIEGLRCFEGTYEQALETDFSGFREIRIVSKKSHLSTGILTAKAVDMSALQLNAYPEILCVRIDQNVIIENLILPANIKRFEFIGAMVTASDNTLNLSCYRALEHIIINETYANSPNKDDSISVILPTSIKVYRSEQSHFNILNFDECHQMHTLKNINTCQIKINSFPPSATQLTMPHLADLSNKIPSHTFSNIRSLNTSISSLAIIKRFKNLEELILEGKSSKVLIKNFELPKHIKSLSLRYDLRFPNYNNEIGLPIQLPEKLIAFTWTVPMQAFELYATYNLDFSGYKYLNWLEIHFQDYMAPFFNGNDSRHSIKLNDDLMGLSLEKSGLAEFEAIQNFIKTHPELFFHSVERARGQPSHLTTITPTAQSSPALVPQGMAMSHRQGTSQSDARVNPGATLYLGDDILCVIIHNDQVVPSREYRFFIQTRVILDKKNSLIYEPNDNLALLVPVDVPPIPDDSLEEHYFCKLSLKALGTELIPLGTLSHENQLMAFSCNEAAVKVFHNPYEGQYYILKTQDSPSLTDVQITYALSPKGAKIVPLTQPHRLPIPLKKLLDTFIQSNDPWRDICNTDETPQTKINQLAEYLLSFESKHADSEKHDIHSFLALIASENGSCRHRADMLFLMSLYFDTPAQLPFNNRHKTTEVWLNDTLQPFDMSGTATEYIYSKKANAFQEKALEEFKAKDKKARKIRLAIKTHVSESTKNLRYTFYQDFLAMARAQTLSNLSDIMLSQKSPLVITSSHLKARLFFEVLLAQNCISPKNTLFIESPEEFLRWYRSFTVMEGKRVKVDGPLYDWIHSKETKILVINWSHMKNKTGSYKSLIDAIPTLHGDRVSDGLTVINLVDTLQGCNEAFVSRCKVFHLPITHPPSSIDKTTENNDNDEPIFVQCYGLPFWREFVVEAIRPQAQGSIALEQRALQEAIASKRPIRIVNPPIDNPDFDRFCYNWRALRQTVVAGKLIHIPPECTLSFIEAPIDNPHNIQIIKKEDDDIPANCIVLNEQTYAQFIECLKIDEEYHAEMLPGYLNHAQAIYVTTELPIAIWQHLCDVISTDYAHKLFPVVIAPGASLGDEKCEPMLDHFIPSLDLDAVHTTTQSGVVATDDISLAIHVLEKNLKHPTVVFINPNTAAQDIFYKQSIISLSDDTLQFRYQPLVLAKALTNGEDVILAGDISPSLWQALLPLYLQSSIELNGEWKTITGKLLLITSRDFIERAHTGMVPCQVMTIDWLNDASLHRFLINERKDDEQKALTAIKTYYAWLKTLPSGGDWYEAVKPLDYRKLKLCIKTLLNPKNTSLQNPLKLLWQYNYPKHHPSYAKSNVWAKYLFFNLTKVLADNFLMKRIRKALSDKAVDTRKLFQYCMIHEIQNAKSAYEHRFQLLNCFPAADLKIMFEATTIEPIDLSETKFEVFFNTKIKPIINHHKKMAPEKTCGRAMKLQHTLKGFIQEEDSHFLYLMGPEGVGKTHSIRHILNEDYAIIEADIKKALTTSQKCVVLLNEANLYEAGMFDFFQSLLDDLPYVVFHGEKYPKPTFFKVIFTGNPDYYPGRNSHAFFQNIPRVYCDLPYIDFLRQVIVKPIFQNSNVSSVADMSQIIKTFITLRKDFPFKPISLRDLVSVSARYIYLAQHLSAQQALAQAFCQEFHDLYPNEHHLNAPVKVNDKYYPRSWSSIIEAINTSIIINKDTSRSYAVKRAILLEGPRGVGKTTLLQELAHEHKVSIDEITVGSPEVKSLLEQAFHEGHWVVLDELNLDKEVETLLNALLDGVDSTGKPAAKPGFMIFASQNPSYYVGTNTLAAPLLNRMQRFKITDFTKQDLLDIMTDAPLDGNKKQSLAEAFLDAQITEPEKLDARHFFTALEKISGQCKHTHINYQRSSHTYYV